jgi:hypothetical protein
MAGLAYAGGGEDEPTRVPGGEIVTVPDEVASSVNASPSSTATLPFGGEQLPKYASSAWQPRSFAVTCWSVSGCCSSARLAAELALLLLSGRRRCVLRDFALGLRDRVTNRRGATEVGPTDVITRSLTPYSDVMKLPEPHASTTVVTLTPG